MEFIVCNRREQNTCGWREVFVSIYWNVGDGPAEDGVRVSRREESGSSVEG